MRTSGLFLFVFSSIYYRGKNYVILPKERRDGVNDPFGTPYTCTCARCKCRAVRINSGSDTPRHLRS